MARIRVTIDKQAKIKVDAEGFTGTSCKNATKVLEDLGTVTETVDKPDLYEVEDEEHLEQ